MGLDGRPSRSSKDRAKTALHEMEYDDDDLEPDTEGRHFRRARARSPRRARNTRSSFRLDTSEEEDENGEQVLDQNDTPIEENPIMEHDPHDLAHYDPPVQVRQLAEDSEIENAFDNEHEALADEDAYEPEELEEDPVEPIPYVKTKSGRVSKPPQQALPMTPPLRSRRNALSVDMPETREQRLERRRRKSEAIQDLDYGVERDTSRQRSRTRKAKPSYPLSEMNDDDEDDFDDEEEIIRSLPRSTRTRSTRSRLTKLEDRETGNGHRRLTRRKSASQLDPNDLTYTGKTSQLQSANGIERPVRQTRSHSVRYVTRSKHSDPDIDGEAEGDGDFPSPALGSGDESADREMEDVFQEDQDVLEREPHGADSDSEVNNARPRRSRRARKNQPRRTVPAKRKRRSTRVARDESSVARETRKSYHPRSESLRPSDFYPDVESASEDSFSSAELGPPAKRSRPIRAAASRAGDAIANKLAPVDYLQNPMATMDAALPLRQPRPGRYSRRKSRHRPTGPDPFHSDDDTLMGSAVATGIEPIQVDMNLSWEDVGGLDHHVRALKEMVALPLMYPEVFEKFKMEAPKGVLFYGPPGTGKTLCARALAASCGGDPEPSSAKSDEPRKATTTADTQVEKTLVQPDPSASEFPKQSEIEDGNLTKEQPNPDVIMAGQPPKNIHPIEKNGTFHNNAISIDDLLITETQPIRDVSGAGTIASEHATVVAQRSKELHDKHAKAAAPARKADGTEHDQKSIPETDQKVRTKPRVSFFMRNGADCLSKWVGEAERQLRMTFEAAKKHQPSIIFFDEIDGLAPVRSSRQDQIHSSIVSTLLGLMDGLDARGQVVVIGATNRVDAIDPALRRPGRFDRELIFTLPNVQARRKILEIHTAKWTPPPAPDVLDAVANMTVGYCGADMKSLCSESALRALRRRYPQIYESKEKLLINPDEVKVTTRDFLSAMRDIVPASHRSARTHARPIPERLGAVLNGSLEQCMGILRKIFPQGLEPVSAKDTKLTQSSDSARPGQDEVEFSDDSEISSEDEGISPVKGGGLGDICNAGRLRPSSGGSVDRIHNLRPRLLVCGMQGLGQGQLGPAILHNYESCPVHAIDYPSLLGDAGSRCAEEALMSAFREAVRSVPSILYLPHLQLWWESASESLKTTLVIALKDIPADLPLLVLATAEKPFNGMPQEVTELFGETLELGAPSEESRRKMFAPLLEQAQAIPRLSASAARRRRKRRKTEMLPTAPPPAPKQPSAEETMNKVLGEDRLIRRMRMDMRAFVENLLRDRRFKAFWNPVDPVQAPDYYDIIKTPMDISRIASEIDLGKYPTVFSMVNDFEVLVQNAIKYNPPNTETGAAILRRAHGLIDIVHAWVDNLNPMLVETCNKIIAERVSKHRKDMAERERNEVREEDGEGGNAESSTEKQGTAEEVGGGNNELDRLAESVKEVESVKPMGSDVEMNGCERDGTKQGGGEGVSKVHVEYEDEEIAEIAVAANLNDVMRLGMQIVAVSTGVTVDGLERLYMRCRRVLRDERRNKNRNTVVKKLWETVVEARLDAAIVGQLVE